MPRIRFTADPKLPRDLAHLGYRKDDEVDLSDDQADRWLRRGVATVIPDAEVADAAEPQPLCGNCVRHADGSFECLGTANPDCGQHVAIPDDWQDQHHMQRIALARRLTDGTVETAVDADQVISEEVERRAAIA